MSKDKTTLPHLLQKSFEWYTPGHYIEAAREVMGGDIDLDPASNAQANRTVKATRYYDIANDGLTQTWQAARLWLNPPYCKSGSVSNQESWTCKLIAEYEAGHVEQAILLVNAATETRWFQRLYRFPICFVRGRIHFHCSNGIVTRPTVGSAFVYFGAKYETFDLVYRQFGVVIPGVWPVESANLWSEMESVRT